MFTVLFILVKFSVFSCAHTDLKHKRPENGFGKDAIGYNCGNKMFIYRLNIDSAIEFDNLYVVLCCFVHLIITITAEPKCYHFSEM